MKKDKIISLRLSEKEYEDYKKITELRNEKLSKFIRYSLKNCRVTVVDGREQIIRLNNDLARIGNALVHNSNAMIAQLKANELIKQSVIVANKQKNDEIIKALRAEIKDIKSDIREILMQVKGEDE